MTHLAHVMLGDSTKKTTGIRAPYFDGTQPCSQTDPELFFPSSTGEANKSKKLIRMICNSCEFKEECLEYSLTVDVYGAWGGYLETERKNMKRQRKLSA
jgi:hypothetical protein